jgi:hypothetical protein
MPQLGGYGVAEGACMWGADLCLRGRAPAPQGARKPQAISLLEEVEELVVAWVWRRLALGREPTLAEVG